MLKTLLVVDSKTAELTECFPNVLSFEEYLRDYPKRDEPKTRLINLCDSALYLSRGYYCSLLAEARQHTVIPSVKTVNEIRGGLPVSLNNLLRSANHEALEALIRKEPLFVYMGRVVNPAFTKLARVLFRNYPSPILKLSYRASEQDFVLEREAYVRLSSEQQAEFLSCLQSQMVTSWKTTSASKGFRWDMAILLNPNEAVPPSNKGAIKRFIKSAAKLGIRAQSFSVDDLLDLNHFDALFIRETTAINHHTYRLACEAESKGLVVLDDSQSILRCCNKVFLHDAFSYQKVASPKTLVLDDSSTKNLDYAEQELDYPMVLKMPEGSFSRGVFKVENRVQLLERLDELFAESALVLAQEYLYTEYDWRIGMLNGRAMYACRYYMAPKHWQIYNHASKRAFSGGFECLPTFEVPRMVLDAAIKAAKVVGDGLYGVDIKVFDNKAYVIEVNDNPNIDYKIEDAYLGEELYMLVMSEFLRRLELRGR